MEGYSTSGYGAIKGARLAAAAVSESKSSAPALFSKMEFIESGLSSLEAITGDMETSLDRISLYVTEEGPSDSNSACVYDDSLLSRLNMIIDRIGVLTNRSILNRNRLTDFVGK